MDFLYQLLSLYYLIYRCSVSVQHSYLPADTQYLRSRKILDPNFFKILFLTDDLMKMGVIHLYKRSTMTFLTFECRNLSCLIKNNYLSRYN